MKAKEIRKFISENPTMSNKEVADELGNGLKWTNIRAHRAHVTMKTDTDSPQPRKATKKKGVKAKKGTKKPSTKYTPVGEKKRDARFIKVKNIINSKVLDGKVLTLCGESVLIEKMLHSNGGKFSYDLVESCPNIFKKILSKVSTMNLDVNSVTNGTIGSKIFEAHEDKYSHLILDYCGLLRTFKSEIETAIENKVVRKGGIIAMTFSTRNARPVIETEKVKGEAISYTAAKKYFSKFNGYELINSFKYKDTGDMMVFILQRVK